MDPLYQLKKFNKILWIDPNTTIQVQLDNFHFYFGNQNFKHFKNTQGAVQFIKNNQKEKYIIMMSSKVFLPEGRQFSLFDQFQAVYTKCIIFCGKKNNLNLSGFKVVGAFDDHFKVMQAVQNTEQELLQIPNIINNFNFKFILVNDKNAENQMNTIIKKQRKYLNWNHSITVEQLTKAQFEATVQDFDPNITQCIAFSYYDQLSSDLIEEMLGNYQSIVNWVILHECKEEFSPESSSGLTIEALSYKKFEDKILKYVKEGL